MLTSLERRAVLSLGGLFGLRMLGLFMLLPIASPFAQHMPGATPLLVGMVLGIYGLTQALGQLPFGMLSDQYPRKHIIAIGFIIFITGSITAAVAPNIHLVILGRALQGLGAIGSTIIALLTDLTREEERSKSMAVIGVMIGFSFFIAIMLAPALSQAIGVKGVFWLTAILGAIALLVNYFIVPSPAPLIREPHPLSIKARLLMILEDKKLLSLDIGIFCLHATLTATFVVAPLILKNLLAGHTEREWLIYLPTMLLAVIFTFGGIGWAEKSKRVPTLYISMIILLAIATLLLALTRQHLLLFSISLMLFFTAFNTLEANLPSLISRVAPAHLKGTAIGIYSTCQFFGIFCGGVAGGYLYGHHGLQSALFLGTILACVWFLLALRLPIKLATSTNR